MHPDLDAGSRFRARQPKRIVGIVGGLRLLLLSGALVLAGSGAKASLLNLDPSTPDFMTSFLSVSYNAGNSNFLASGLTTDYQGGSAALVNAGNYSLSATINHSGVLTGGSLLIKGDIGSGDETLLTGTLKTGPGGTAFGFQDPSDAPPRNLFEFLFTVTGGDPVIVNDFGGPGIANRGVIVTAEFQNGGTPFTGVWTSSFNNNGSGFSDNFAPVPEPASASLLLLGGALLLAKRRFHPGLRMASTNL